MTRGRAATPDPFDISAVSDSDELFDALSARRLPVGGRPDIEDPAAALLAALVADVDAGAPPLPAPSRAACGVQGQCRRGVRAFATFGVAALVLGSAGAAAAGGGEGVGAMTTTQGSARPGVSERSNENTQRLDPTTGDAFTGHRSPSRHTGDKHRSAPAADDASRASEGPQQRGHRAYRSSRGYPRSATDLHYPSTGPDPYSSTGRRKPPSRPESAPLDP